MTKHVLMRKLVSEGALIAVFFWIYAIYRADSSIQGLIDWRFNWSLLGVSLIFLVIWFTSLGLLYELMNKPIWIGEIFVYIFGVLISFVVVESFLFPIYMKLGSKNLFDRSSFLSDISFTIYQKLPLITSISFVIYEFDILYRSINSVVKIKLRLIWLLLIILISLYFLMIRYAQ